MSQRFDQLDNRRQFLRFMAASPLLVHGAPGWLQLGDDGEAITDPRDALDVFDFREVAEKVLPPAHYGYLATGVDDDWDASCKSGRFQEVSAQGATPHRCKAASTCRWSFSERDGKRPSSWHPPLAKRRFIPMEN